MYDELERKKAIGRRGLFGLSASESNEQSHHQRFGVGKDGDSRGKFRHRLRRATQALEAVGIPYAVVGGNAVAAWVGEVDEAAIRNTQDVDILLRRADLE